MKILFTVAFLISCITAIAQPYKKFIDENNQDHPKDCDPNAIVTTYRHPGSIKYVDSDFFNKLPTTDYRLGYKKMNSDSLEKIVVKRYPKIFKKVNGNFKFSGISGDSIVVGSRLNSPDDKNNYHYQLISLFCNKVIASLVWYEGEGHVVIDLQTGIAYATFGKPVFWDCDKYYATGDDNGYGDIALVNIASQSSISLSYPDWLVKRVTHSDGVLYSELVGLEKFQGCKHRYVAVSN